jgi:serine/threonine protein kinase
MPDTIGGYQILRKLAESHTAEIYHVLRLVGKGRGKEFALKALRPEFASDAVEKDHLENEFQLCSAMEHRNLVGAHEVETDGARPFLVMDLILGRSLREMIDREPQKAADVLEWHAQEADGLVHFHSLGYVHRDVKPQNLMIGDDGVVRVIDFALAMKQDTALGGHLLRKFFNRRTPGTGSYMSPEQIRNGRITGQADVYSLGVSLFEAIAGRLPYAAEKANEVLHQHVYAPVPSLAKVRPDVLPEVDDFVRAMMAKAPGDRPSGMVYVGVKLRELAALYRKAAGRTETIRREHHGTSLSGI